MPSNKSSPPDTDRRIRTTTIRTRAAKPRHLQPWVGLPNILCGDFVVPELLQSNAKPELLRGALADWLDAPERMRAVQEKFRDMHVLLQRDTATLATDAIEKVLSR